MSDILDFSAIALLFAFVYVQSRRIDRLEDKRKNREEWRSINDLPDELPEEDEWEIMCIVTWQHAHYPQDKGTEVSSLRQIREGDFLGGEYKDAVWRALMDSPTFKEP